jgi:hypothetical protein
MVRQIHNPEELAALVNEIGFLPFFFGGVRGFSVEEFTPRSLWFSGENDGPWEWKGPAIIDGSLAYGKFFAGKAGYISLDWFPHFVNYRRHRYSLSEQEKMILSTLKENKSLLSKELKRLCGYIDTPNKRVKDPLEKELIRQNLIKKEVHKSHKQAFDTAITHLQMSGNVVTADFEYNYDKEGKRYGWGVARYCTPEDFFGAEAFNRVNIEPSESLQLIVNHLLKILPYSSECQILQIIG